MGDVITFLQFLQKLEQGKLIPTEQIEHLADILKSTLRKNLCNGVYDSLEELLESQLNGNEQNPLFIDILETTPKPKEKDTLTKLTEFLEEFFQSEPDPFIRYNNLKYDLEFEVPSKHIEYSYIIKDPDLGYIIKYRIVQGYSKYEYSTPISYLNSDHINTIWEAIQERNSNE